MKPPTDQQWDAIRETERHILVSAGAGTGKTQTVVGHIMYLMGAEIPGRDERCADPIRLDDIAAITYTNQAAADLKRKLREELREAGFRDAAYAVDSARIGTIHSFCGDVMREFALRCGRSPAAHVLDEGEASSLATEVVRDTLLEALDAEHVDGLAKLLAVWGVSDVRGWIELLISDGDRLANYRAMRERLGAHEGCLVELADRAHSALCQRLEHDGAIDFSRMIVWTRDIIRDQPAVRAALQRRLRVLVVDEFQDVDPVQRDIAYLLGDLASPDAGASSHAPAGPPDRPTTRLMLVGDPKQSIYRFRRADVTVWRAVERDFQNGAGVVVPLSRSFRTVAPILAAVDWIFGPLMNTPVEGDELQDFEVPFGSVSSMRTDGPTDQALEILTIPAGTDGKQRKVDDCRAIEAEAVAARIAELREREGYRLGEIAILLASWASANVYEAALRRAGIPTYLLREKGFYERREVLDLVLALRTIRDPRDDLALYGFLRSPFVGVKDETLLAIAREGGRGYWERREQWGYSGDIAEEEMQLLRTGVTLVARLASARDRVPTVELLHELLESSGYLAHLVLLGDEGAQAIANVRKFLRTARSMADASVGDLLRTLEESRARGDREGDARLYGERDDVVTITSIHSAKGLEWRAVFWCDLARGRKPDYGERLLAARHDLVLGESDVSYKEQEPRWCELWKLNEREEQAEARRLWYVAATRARDLLVFAGVPEGIGKAGSCPAQVIADVAGIGGAQPLDAVQYPGDGRPYSAIVTRARISDEPGAEESTAPGELLDASILPPPLQRHVAGSGRTRHSATELMLFERCPMRHWLRYRLGIREPDSRRAAVHASADEGSNQQMDPRTRGQIVHHVLEHHGSGAALSSLIETAIETWAPDAPAAATPSGVAYRTSLGTTLERVLADPIHTEISNRPTARRELTLLMPGDEHGAIEATLDLAAAGDDGLWLLDVKTGSAPSGGAAAAESYRVQRTAYSTAVSALTGLPVTRFVFQFAESGESIVFGAASNEESEQLNALIANVARSHDEGPALAQSPRECSRCGYREWELCAGVNID